MLGLRHRSTLLVGLACCACSGSSSSAQPDGGAVSHADATAATDARVDSDARAGDAHLASDAHDARVAPEAAASTRANGTVGTWQTLAPSPLPRANHCAVATAGFLVVIGGNYEPDGGSSFVDIDAVNVAALHGDGSLGAWSQAGTTPSPVNSCTLAANGTTLYLVDGIYDDMADQGQVFSAQLSPSGTIGSWTPLGVLANGQDAFSSVAWVAPTATATLYTFDSTSMSTALLAVSTAPTLGTWVTNPFLPGFLGRPEYAYTSDYVYAIGGYLSDDAGNPAVTTVSAAPIQSDGTTGASFTTTPLPMPITFGTAVAVDDWMFVIGGKSSLFGSGEPTALSAAIGVNGQLGAWSAQTSLPEGRTDGTVTLAGDFLYVVGGGYTGPGVATVFAARVRF